MLLENSQAFLSLVRLGIGHGTQVSSQIEDKSFSMDWSAIKSLADEHGLSAIILDGIGSLSDSKRPPEDVLIPWIGSTLMKYEHRYEMYCHTIADLARWYHAHGCKMMVLKGYACSLDWPKPEHRPCGDIDIWLFGKQQEADAALKREMGIQVDSTHHHHTVFYWQNFMVENHYDFVNVHHSKSNASIEIKFKSLGNDDAYYVDVYGERVYVPSPNLHALFLLRHSMIEFAASGITLRQLLDWAFFVEAHKNEIDWIWLEDILEHYGMKKLYHIYNTICIEDLKFNAHLFTNVQYFPELKKKVLREILYPAIPNKKPTAFIHRVIWKYRRWKNNKWKHELCYQESMWSAFGSGVWGHLLKPSTI